ncbi:hypothetical protein EC968_009753 [Mortierella alpina]|nr:hypothetical protein EC968_009753 [Mortierella alpina]
MGAYTPHLDQLKRGLQYIVDSSVEYEDCNGNGTFKGAGAADALASYKPKKPAGRSKAVLAAHAHQQAFSQDPQIHAMEDSLQAIVEMQQQMEAERATLESLTNMIGQGMRLPAKDLHASFEHLLKAQAKQQQTRRKQQIKARGAPGGMEPELFDLRTKIWEVHHSRDPLPMGAGTGAGGGADEDEDEDMEIVVSAAASVQELKCPITTNFLEDPVTSSVCKHSFSREAIISLIRSGGRSSSLCPVHGCNRPVTVEMLQPNKALARKVERQKMVEEELLAHEDEEYTTVE